MIRTASRATLWVCCFTIAIATAGFAPRACADSPNELEKKARGSLSRLYKRNKLAADNVNRAFAVLVFPDARKLALGLGLETATGILFQRMKPVSFHNLTAFSCGLGMGVRKFDYAIFFMTEDALDYLYDSRGFDLGTSPSLIVADSICSGSFGTTSQKEGILTFTFHQTGFMVDVGLNLAKITEYEPSD